MNGTVSVIEEAPTNEPDEPVPTGPSAPPLGSVRKANRKKAAAALLMVLVLVLPIMLAVLNRPAAKNPPGHGIPSWPEVNVPPWRLYMNVTDHKTLSHRNLTISGDILVQEDAALDLVDCNITMNGTFYIAGALNLRNSSFRNMPKVHGFDISTYWVLGSPVIHSDSPAIIANLSNCSRAWLNFSAEYDTESEVSLDVVKDGVRTTIQPGFLGASNGTENVSVDLSRFCGGVVRLEFRTDGYINSCHILGPVVETDRFRTESEDLIIDWREDWGDLSVFYYPFHINANGGNVSIEGCTVVRQPSTEDLVTAFDSDVRITDSEFREEPAGPGHSSGGSGLLDGERSSVLVRDSVFLGSFGIGTNNSDLRVEDSVFNDQSGSTAWTTNSRVTVTGCTFNSCDSGIFGMIDTPGAGGFVTIQDSTFDCEEEAIGLKAIFGTVERCTIKARYPFVIHPNDRFSRTNCTMASIAAISGNSVRVQPYSGDPEDEIAVWLFSAIPVEGLEGLVKNNTWNASVPVARCIFLWLRTNWFPGIEPEVSFERNGTRSEYDSALARTGEATAREGRENARERNEVIFFQQPYDDTSGYTWNTRRLIPMDRFFINGTGFSRLSLDERRLDFLLSDPVRVVRTRFDASPFRHPAEVIRLQNSTSAVQVNAGDLSLSALVFVYDPARSVLNLTFTMETKGRVPDQVELTCTLGGRLLESWTSAPWTGPWPALTIDRQNLSSGEMVIRAVPLAMEDWNLSNNELRLAVNLVNESRVIEGEAELGGLWLLADGADLTIRNCRAGLAGTGAIILGLGNNSLTVESSTVDLGVGRLSLNVSRGSIRDSDFSAGKPDWNSYRGWPSLEMVGDDWDIKNVTLGCRASDFEGYRERYLSDPMNALYELYMIGQGPFIPRVWLTTAVRSLNISESNLLPFSWYSFLDNCSLAMTNTTVGGGGYWINLIANQVLLRDCRFEVLEELMLGAAEGTVEDCTFTEVIGGVEIESGNISLTGNEFSSSSGMDWANAGLRLNASNLSIAGNAFSGMRDAVMLEGAGEPSEVAAANIFQNVTGSLVFKTKTVIVEFLHQSLQLRVNREITNLTLHELVLLGWDDRFVSLEHEHINTTQNRTFRFAYWSIDANGTEHRQSEVRCRVVVLSPSGAVSELELLIQIRKEDRWTIQFG